MLRIVSLIHKYSFFRYFVITITLLMILFLIISFRVFSKKYLPVHKKFLPIGYANILDNLPIRFYQKNASSDEPLGLYKYVDKVYAIAMPQRREYITDLFNQLDTKADILKAVHKDDVKKIAQQQFSNRLPFAYYFGEIGCYYSHRQVLKDCVNSQAKLCAIFEDDAISTSNKEELFKKIEQGLKEIPKDWDILYLGVLQDTLNKTPSVSTLLAKSYYPLALHAYVVSRKGAIKILKKTSPTMFLPIDLIYGRSIYYNKLESYSFKENVFLQNKIKLKSLISPGHNLHSFLRQNWSVI